jgi:DNA-binding response OmpR family regulator
MRARYEPQPGADIILVDDEEAIRETYSALLRRAGYRVCTAADGESVLKIMACVPAPLLITDMVMNDTDGAELIRRIRKDNPKTRILAISGGGPSDAKEYLHLAEQVGADSVMSKPLAAEEFLKVVHSLLPLAGNAVLKQP